MKSLFSLILVLSFLLSTSSIAQIKNATTLTLKIDGNCEMCETQIKKAGNKKKVAKVGWDKESKVATIVFNSKETSEDEILKRIALAGYDNEKFLGAR